MPPVHSDNLAPYDGELRLIERYFLGEEADRLFDVLLNRLAWQKENITLFGKTVEVPRRMCWYGDPDAIYTYSGVKHVPLPWSSELLEVRLCIERDFGYLFNSVLANWYRNGHDSMGFHADNEKELGIDPVIVSLSLGDERLFRLIHNKTRQKVDVLLGHGDLLIMAGALQHHWRHGLPKTARPKSARINLTFRKVFGDISRSG